MSENIELNHRFFEQYPYAIVDAGRREEIPDSWPVASIAPAFLENDTARCPLLIDCLGIPEADRNVLLDRLETETTACDETLFSLVLATSASFKPLLKHLAQRLVIRSPTDNLPRQFRYYDPGTFIQLPDVLGGAGMSWLLGLIDVVAVPWLGEWRCCRNSADSANSRFDLRTHWDVLQGFSVVNRVLTQLPEIRDQREWRRKGEATRRLIAHARNTYGLDQRDDLVAFALHAWQCHSAFDRHPILQKLLVELAAAIPDDELNYRELTARLDEADWQKIARDLQAEEIL